MHWTCKPCCAIWVALAGGAPAGFECLRPPFCEAPQEETLWTLGSGEVGKPPTVSVEHSVRKDILTLERTKEQQTLGPSLSENICVGHSRGVNVCPPSSVEAVCWQPLCGAIWCLLP